MVERNDSSILYYILYLMYYTFIIKETQPQPLEVEEEEEETKEVPQNTKVLS